MKVPLAEGRFLLGPAFPGTMDIPEELAALQRFHGHLGVYVTIGLRMGAIGRRALGDYKGLTAVVQSAPQPPMLCIVDGVQFSSGCTMGKGNISVVPAQEPMVTFAKGGRTLRIALKPGWLERIEREMSKEREVEQSLLYFRLAEGDLFDITEG